MSDNDDGVLKCSQPNSLPKINEHQNTNFENWVRLRFFQHPLVYIKQKTNVSSADCHDRKSSPN